MSNKCFYCGSTLENVGETYKCSICFKEVKKEDISFSNQFVELGNKYGSLNGYELALRMTNAQVKEEFDRLYLINSNDEYTLNKWFQYQLRFIKNCIINGNFGYALLWANIAFEKANSMSKSSIIELLERIIICSDKNSIHLFDYLLGKSECTNDGKVSYLIGFANGLLAKRAYKEAALYASEVLDMQPNHNRASAINVLCALEASNETELLDRLLKSEAGIIESALKKCTTKDIKYSFIKKGLSSIREGWKQIPSDRYFDCANKINLLVNEIIQDEKDFAIRYLMDFGYLLIKYQKFDFARYFFDMLIACDGEKYDYLVGNIMCENKCSKK
ncbi:MAG: hypothetical protein HUJ61_03845, partial [Bacilli bacterium]|nr:hypothetical protein [Bacilli bacterium]